MLWLKKLNFMETAKLEMELMKALDAGEDLEAKLAAQKQFAAGLEGRWQLLRHLAAVLGLRSEAEANASLDDGAIDASIAARKAAKAAKDYAEADRIRDELAAQGVQLIDKPGGVTEWIRA